MARNAIPLYVTNQLITAAHGNTYWRDNEAAHWAAIAAAGGIILIEEKLLGAPAASFDFTAIPATYRHLKLIIDVRGTNVATAIPIHCKFNNDGGANYDFVRYDINPFLGLDASELLAQISFILGNIPAAGADANISTSLECIIPNYREAIYNKTIMSHSGYKTNTTPNNTSLTRNMGFWRSSAVINQVTIYPSANNFNTGSIASLYGLM